MVLWSPLVSLGLSHESMGVSNTHESLQEYAGPLSLQDMEVFIGVSKCFIGFKGKRSGWIVS
ncbi:hypothetical protein E2C01_098871 [Portunus trituberculatus]|uniref:Uncharacterized protein n=1 Tax=Portunus trituberculatus TaxID=210409 RepID=A0A5B7K8U3_PORTR|nr:hypothetical protein [Portunus trituberculatus]